MNTKNNQQSLTEDIRRKIQDYQDTINIIQSFISLLTYDNDIQRQISDSNHAIGRRLDTTVANRVSPGNEVTPDIVIQVGDNLGYVAEVKKSLPQPHDEQDRWSPIATQIERYDDDLIGWWTANESIPTISIILLLDINRSADFVRYLESLIANLTVSFVRPLSIVDFSQPLAVGDFIFLRKHWGSIEDRILDEKLQSGKSIPYMKSKATYGEKKFYDARPETEHTMIALWQDVFTRKSTEAEYSEDKKSRLLIVSLTQLTRELQRLYGSVGGQPREATFPKVSWIREAMEGFVQLGLADQINDGENYTVYFKHLRTELLDRFVRHREARKEIDNSFQQLTIPYD